MSFVRACVAGFLLATMMVRVASSQSPPTSAEQVLAAAATATAESKVDLAKQASEMLLSSDVIESTADYETLLSLVKLAQGELTPGDKYRIAQKLKAKSDGPLTYTAMRQKIAVMFLAGAPLADRAAVAAAWIDADQTGLAGVWEAEYSWLYSTISEPQLKHGTFSVEWQGRLSAPRSGDYTLSISPINVNASWNKFYIRTYWKIVADGQEVLKSSPDKWVTDATPIRLTANQPVDLQVFASFEVSRPAIDAIHAMLSWKGPGTAKQIIPASALSTAAGRPGLDAVYSVTLPEGAAKVERVDPTIDFAWTTDRRVVAGHDAALKKLRAQIWKSCMSPEYLAGCEEGASRRHRHPFLYDLLLVECLTSEQRAAFLKELELRPAMLTRLTPAEAIHFFKAFRFGVEDQALEAWGRWAQSQADLQSSLPERPDQQSFFDINRMEFHDLARCVYQQSPEHFKRLEEEFLATEDGGCVLPVAYVLAYCYQDSGRIDQWQRLIDERLADKELQGDARVNWYLARAMSDEIVGLDESFFTGSNENLTAGWRWLGDAERAAQSPAAKARAVGELIAREAALGQFDGAKRRLTGVSAQMKAAAPVANEWDRKLEEISKRAVSREEQIENAAVDGYWAEMKRRQEAAAQQGDDAEASRLGQLIGEAEQAK